MNAEDEVEGGEGVGSVRLVNVWRYWVTKREDWVFRGVGGGET